MKIFHSAAEIPSDFGQTVVTIGIFDGVHKGHSEILSQTVTQATLAGYKSVALTFYPHPAIVHNQNSHLHLVTSLSDRLERLEAAGLDAVFVQHYDLEYAQKTPREFVQNELHEKLGAKIVVVGQDVRFGKDNSGDGDQLRELCAEFGIEVVILDDICDDDGRRWSSTWVRELLSQGDVAKAAKVLGRPHRIRGIVEHGFKRGRQLGFPTANLTGDNLGEVPREGVYAGWLVTQVVGTAATVHLPAAISIGNNPQFAGEVRTVEAHVLGRSDLNLYGQEIALDFISYLRPMYKFNSVDDLLLQMDEDLRKCAQILSVPLATRVDPNLVTAN